MRIIILFQQVTSTSTIQSIQIKAQASTYKLRLQRDYEKQKRFWGMGWQFSRRVVPSTPKKRGGKDNLARKTRSSSLPLCGQTSGMLMLYFKKPSNAHISSGIWQYKPTWIRRQLFFFSVSGWAERHDRPCVARGRALQKGRSAWSRSKATRESSTYSRR